jgi:hypothetical protein
MRCHLLKVVVDGKALAVWALIGERGSGQEHCGNAAPGLGGEGGGTQVFRWQAALG